MGSSLHVLHELARADPASCKDLIPSLVSILKQICEHRLPREYDYHRMPAPWIQMKILSMLSTLGSADKNASEQMYEILHEVMRRADAGVNVGYAVIYECVKTITSIYPSHHLLEIAASSISRFIGAQNHNLKYVGVTGLSWIVQVNAFYAAQHQLVVVDCLEDPDDTLNRKTLDLLYRMTNPKNVTVVVEKLAFHLRTSVDQHLRRDLASKITHLAERYAPSNHWYLDAMTTVFELAGNLVEPETAYNVTQLIGEGPMGDDEQDMEFRRYAVNKYVRLCEKVHTLPDVLAQVVSWVLGEYGSLCTVEGYTDCNDIIDLLCDSLDRAYEDVTTRGWLVSAITKLCAVHEGQHARSAEGLRSWRTVKAVTDKFKNSQSTSLQQKCYELAQLLEQPTDTLRYILPFDASSEDIQVDAELRFLDSFVAQALADGAAPYVPLERRTVEQTEVPVSQPHSDSSPHNLVFTPYGAPVSASSVPKAPSAFAATTGKGGQPGGLDTSFGETQRESTATTCGFEVQGPRRWGPSGYVPSTASSAATSASTAGSSPSPAPPPPPPPRGPATATSTAQAAFGAAPLTTAPPPPPPPPPPARELTEREKKAAALFTGLGGGNTAPRLGESSAEGPSGVGVGTGAGGSGVARSSTSSGLTVSGTPGFFRPSDGRDGAKGAGAVPPKPESGRAGGISAATGTSGIGTGVNNRKAALDLLDLDSPNKVITAGHEPVQQEAVKDTSRTMDMMTLDLGESVAEPVHENVSVVLEPLVLTTAEVGSQWGQLSAERKGTVGSGHAVPQEAQGRDTCAPLMDKLKNLLSTHTVEIIGVEGIASAQTRRTSGQLSGCRVFLHCKLVSAHRANIIVKAETEKLADDVLGRCISELIW